MAKNLELREKISGSFNATDSLLYIRTHVNQVDGLLAGNKLSLTLIPSALLETKKLAGFINSDISLSDALTLIANYHNDETTLYPGSYLISQGQHTLSNSANHIIQYNDDGLPAGDTVTLENGDHLFYIKQGFAYVWNEVTIDVLDTVTGAYTFASIEELSSKVPTTANVSAIVTGYKWSPIDATEYAASANKLVKSGSVSNPTRWDINEVEAPVAGKWTSNNGDLVLSYDDGAGISYWRLTEVIPGGMSETLFGGNIAMYKSITNASQHLWGVINNSYNIATEEAQGIMSAGMVKKLNGIEAGANKYIHATDGADETLTAGGIQKIAAITVNSLGHVTAVSLESIQDGSPTQKGVLQLANVSQATEWKSAQSTDKPAAPNLVKTMIDYFATLKIYNSTTEADAAHPDGALALFTTTV